MTEAASWVEIRMEAPRTEPSAPVPDGPAGGQKPRIGQDECCGIGAPLGQSCGGRVTIAGEVCGPDNLHIVKTEAPISKDTANEIHMGAIGLNGDAAGLQGR